MQFKLSHWFDYWSEGEKFNFGWSSSLENLILLRFISIYLKTWLELISSFLLMSNIGQFYYKILFSFLFEDWVSNTGILSILGGNRSQNPWKNFWPLHFPPAFFHFPEKCNFINLWLFFLISCTVCKIQLETIWKSD